MDVFYKNSATVTFRFRKDGEPAEIGPGDFYFTVKPRPGSTDTDEDAIIQKIKLDYSSSQGVISFELTPQDLKIEPGQYKADIKRFSDNNTKVRTYDMFNFNVIETVTQSENE